MQKLLLTLLLTVSLSVVFSCKNQKETHPEITQIKKQLVQHAKGFQIEEYSDYSVLTILQPWPKATKNFTYILKKKNAAVPENLQQYPQIDVPIKNLVVTSTTHIPSLEMLKSENRLIGFPGTNLISSSKTRKLIDTKKIVDIGINQDLNTELLIDLQPDVLVGFTIDDQNKTYDILAKSGIEILYNGDWVEETPLGKAEWIKFFGVLLDKSSEADAIFNSIEKNYNDIKEAAQKASTTPTVLSGAIYQDQWYLPGGKSWASIFLKDAKAQYLWGETTEVGSLSLSFETVLEKAENADFWIGPAQFVSLEEMIQNNPNYKFFKSFKEQKIYSFSNKKGKTGGVLYYELAPNRPDLLLKDLVSIIHPEIYSNHELFFFEKLK
ncbi:ABC transporter substrate-binding protein [Flavobacterium sp. NST-5]|uniref:ABC transporter substrate-binding protein n=1 Tax=Flavobacterium ichthyis TaxID=2698827 RepID=A0ABW9ZAT4_9FLAO|nr:ABC transporter substrate-binding protein [Flavobacterium ichthyis]NBL66033.1 ABC transporter substrate-binding protein [Flavobacterium ichthyis]